MNRFDRARSILNDGVRMKAFPAAVIEVGTAETILWHEAFGHSTYDTDTPTTDSETIFDLARRAQCSPFRPRRLMAR